MKFTAQIGGRAVVVLAGADWQGVEYYDANNTVGNLTNVLGSVQNAFGGMFSSGGAEKPKNRMEFFMQGGLVGQMFHQQVMEAQQTAMMAGQMRLQAIQRQLDLSRHIAQNNVEISAGIMDSYSQRSPKLHERQLFRGHPGR